MPRHKKDAKPITFRMDRETADRLEKYADIMGQTKTIAVERILKEHFDCYDEKQLNAKLKTK